MTVETLTQRASWLETAADDDFCHIADSGVILCGAAPGSTNEAAPCAYSRAMICPTCGLPHCPRCAVLDDLAYRLEAT